MTATLITTVRDNPYGLSQVISRFRDFSASDDRMIIIDDGSIDPIADPQVPRVTLLSPGRIGRGPALNLAIAAADDGIIAINDADDLPRSDRLCRAKTFLSERLGLVVTPNYGSPLLLSSPVPISRLFRGNPFPHSGFSFTKALWRHIGGYDESLPSCLDLDFLYRAAALTPILFDPRPACWRDAAGGGRWYARIAEDAYLETLLSVRAKHRATLAPPLWCHAWDWRLRMRRWRACFA